MATGQLAVEPPVRASVRIPGVPVLLYHGLTGPAESEVPPREAKYWVSAARFKDHLELINRSGYRVTLLQELWNATNASDHAKSLVVLTFDDGRASDYQVAYQLLLEAGLRALFFVNTAAIGQQGYLNWANISEMERAGMSFQ